MEYYMLDKRDISIVCGIVTTKQVREELGLSSSEFTKLVRNGGEYKGCILIPLCEDDRELVTSKTEELYQLIGESSKGFKYYVTSHLRVVSISPKKKKEREIEVSRTPCGRYRTSINIGSKRKCINVLKECYQAFIGPTQKGDSVVCDGELKIENLRLITSSVVAARKKMKSVRVGDVVYESVAECAQKNFFSERYVYQMLEGVKPNKLGVELA